MTVEEQVREALQRAGHERPVDVARLQASTRAELARREAPRRRRRWTGWAPMALAATSVAGLVAVIWSVSGLDWPSVLPGPSAGQQGEVDNTFTCPQTRLTRFGPGNRDDSFLPELTSGLKPAGEAAGAPLWESQRVADGAVLRLGNGDGSLASVVTFEKSADGYRAVRTTKCSNDARGGAVSTQLILDDLPAPPPYAFTERNVPTGSLRVLDRATYDVRGLAKRYTMWAEPCEETVCLVAGSSHDFTTARLRARSPLPEDRSGQLADPDDTVGQHLGLRLVAVYDRQDTLRAVTWANPHGDVTRVAPVRGGGWQGHLFLFLVADPKLASVTLQPHAGEARTYQPDEFGD